MSESPRPKHVVIVDANDPMREVEGEFFWREDHEQILSVEREVAFREGFERGLRAAAQQEPPVVQLRYRRPWLTRALIRSFVLFVLLAFALALLGFAR